MIATISSGEFDTAEFIDFRVEQKVAASTMADNITEVGGQRIMRNFFCPYLPSMVNQPQKRLLFVMIQA